MPPLTSRTPVPSSEWEHLRLVLRRPREREEEGELMGGSSHFGSWGFGSLLCQGWPSVDNWYGETLARSWGRTLKGSPVGICGYFIITETNITATPSILSNSSGFAWGLQHMYIPGLLLCPLLFFYMPWRVQGRPNHALKPSWEQEPHLQNL